MGHYNYYYLLLNVPLTSTPTAFYIGKFVYSMTLVTIAILTVHQ